VTIPKIFHHIWPGSDEIPVELRGLRQTWMDHHPGWRFYLWRHTDLGWLRNRRLFLQASSYAQKADIARYEVVHRFGGVYVDADMECLRPVDPLLEGLRFFAGREPSGAVCNAFFGAVPGHDLLREVIEAIPASCAAHRRVGINEQTGPGLLTRVVERGGWAHQPGVRIFPPAFFYPYNWDEPWRRHERFPRAYAVHRWRHGWKADAPLRVAPADLVPSGVRSLKALVREGMVFAGREARRHLATPGRRKLKELIKRAVVAAELPRAVPWGPGEVLVQGPLGTFLLCPTDDLSIAPELALRGTYDDRFVRFLQRALRRGMTFVDVGANIGLFTIVAAKLVGPGGRVFSFECNPDLLPWLRRNVRMNWFEDRVEVIPKAAHRDATVHELIVPDDRTGLGSLVRFNDAALDPSAHRRYEVEGERLDIRLAEVDRIDLMKVDVEGGEAAVLDGAVGLLRGNRIGMLSVEFRDDALPGRGRSEMERWLKQLAGHYGGTFHVPDDPRPIPLDEVLTVAHYPQLLVRLPGSRIAP
jgi:FkbM family methyltransferase